MKTTPPLSHPASSSPRCWASKPAFCSTVLVLAYRKMGVYYELTTQRFIHKAGILKRTSDRLEVIDIDDVTFSALNDRLTEAEIKRLKAALPKCRISR